MVSKPLYVVFRLALNISHKIVISGIKAARKHEVLPDQDAVPVAQVIETVVLIDAPAPNSEHVHVCPCCIGDCPFIYFGRDIRKKDIARNVVRSFHKNWLSVEFKAECPSVFRGLVPDKPQRA